MKRIAALLLAAGLLLTGCGGETQDLMKDVKPSDQGGFITVSDLFRGDLTLRPTNPAKTPWWRISACACSRHLSRKIKIP